MMLQLQVRLERFARAWALTLLIAAIGAYAGGTTLAVEVAGELFVDVDAATLGLQDTTWTNAGTYTDFMAVGNPGVTKDPIPAVWFDGNSAFVGSDSAPEGLTGLNPTRSIEVWAWNPSIASEETLVSWGQRGGPEGSNMAFNYGNHGNFGAVGHWGGGTYDLGWIDNDFTPGAPDEQQWHLLTYTYDGEVTRVYADGQLWNEEDTLDLWGDIDTHPDPAIAIASQWEPDGVTLNGPLRGSLFINRMRIHDGVLSDAQIAANYNEEKDFFTAAPTQPPPPPLANPEFLTAGPIHRYGFNNPATADASDAIIEDSVGGAHGVVLGDGSSLSGTQLHLDGGSSDFAAYVDLPNELISPLTSVTFEGWATTEGVQTWSRIFDFGSNDPGGDDGEIEGPGDDNGGGTEGLDYIFLSAHRGNDPNTARVEIRDEDPAGGGATTIDANIQTELPSEQHFVVSYEADPAGGGTIRYYRDGRLAAEGTTQIDLEDINDVNNWLGRSNWTNDANFEGSYDEFRIYDYALTEGQAVGNFLLGPDTLNLPGGGDLDGDGDCDADDIDTLSAAIRAGQTDAKFDLNGDGSVNLEDHKAFIVEVKKTWIGDANLDGLFNTDDLLNVFQAGEYEDTVAANSGWAEGDWNADAEFTSGDLLAAFQDGGFEQGRREGVAAVPEPTGLLVMGSLLGIFGLWRGRHLRS